MPFQSHPSLTSPSKSFSLTEEMRSSIKNDPKLKLESVQQPDIATVDTECLGQLITFAGGSKKALIDAMRESIQDLPEGLDVVENLSGIFQLTDESPWMNILEASYDLWKDENKSIRMAQATLESLLASIDKNTSINELAPFFIAKTNQMKAEQQNLEKEWQWRTPVQDLQEYYAICQKYNIIEQMTVSAEAQVFAQAYRRLMCPTHQLGDANLFSVSRVAACDDIYRSEQPAMYVLSKNIPYANISSFQSVTESGEVIFDSTPTVRRDTGAAVDLSQYHVQLEDIAGLATCSLLSKVLRDRPDYHFVLQNIKDGAPFLTCTTSHSSKCFGGIYQLLAQDKTLLFDQLKNTPVTSEERTTRDREVTFNPYTSIPAIRNLFSQMPSFDALLMRIGQTPQAVKETMSATLRCALLPAEYQTQLLNAYFDKNKVLSRQVKEDIEEYLTQQQASLVDILSTNEKCLNYFLNQEVINEGRLRQELEQLYESLRTFEAYTLEDRSVVRPIDYLEDFDERFIQAVMPFVALLLNKELNLEVVKSFFKEVKDAATKNPSSFNELFCRVLENGPVLTPSQRETAKMMAYGAKAVEEVFKTDSMIFSKNPQPPTHSNQRNIKVAEQRLPKNSRSPSSLLPPLPEELKGASVKKKTGGYSSNYKK